ncbi:MAG: hypothetical protein ACJAVK_002155, partial [Akkermansiaceae bacterium]
LFSVKFLPILIEDLFHQPLQENDGSECGFLVSPSREDFLA